MSIFSRLAAIPGRMAAAARSAVYRDAAIAADAEFRERMNKAGGWRTNPPRRGQAEAIEFYRISPIFRAACKLISNSVAATTFKALVPTRGGNVARQGPDSWYTLRQQAASPEKSRELAKLRKAGKCAEIGAALAQARRASKIDAPESGISRILGRNLGTYDGRTLIGQSQIYRLVVGEIAWVLAKSGTNPQNGGRIIPAGAMAIPPTWIIDTPREGSDSYRLSRYGWQEQVPADHIVWHREPDLVDPLGRGLGATHTLATELEIDEDAAKVMRDWMAAGGVGSTMVMGPDFDPGKMAELWKKAKRDRGQGVPFFWRGSEATVRELHNLGATAATSEVRRAQFDLMRAYFNLPPELFGQLENSNRATINEAWAMFCRTCLIPELEFWRMLLQSFCDYYFGEGIYLIDYASPIPENREHSLSVAQAFPSAFTVREIRGIAGHPPFEDGRDDLIILPPGVRMVKDLEAEADQGETDPGELEDPPEE